jgi:hypothetical protein
VIKKSTIFGGYDAVSFDMYKYISTDDVSEKCIPLRGRSVNQVHSQCLPAAGHLLLASSACNEIEAIRCSETSVGL